MFSNIKDGRKEKLGSRRNLGISRVSLIWWSDVSGLMKSHRKGSSGENQDVEKLVVCLCVRNIGTEVHLPSGCQLMQLLRGVYWESGFAKRSAL